MGAEIVDQLPHSGYGDSLILSPAFARQIIEDGDSAIEQDGLTISGLSAQNNSTLLFLFLIKDMGSDAG